MTPPASAVAPPATVRCAIYTRKSTEEGLDQAFTSLDAQREAALAYVHSLEWRQQLVLWKALQETTPAMASPRVPCESKKPRSAGLFGSEPAKHL